MTSEDIEARFAALDVKMAAVDAQLAILRSLLGDVPAAPVQHVRITVTGYCGHVLWSGFDVIEDKYPFYCDECEDDRRTGSYPWKLTTEIVSASLSLGDEPSESGPALDEPVGGE